MKIKMIMLLSLLSMFSTNVRADQVSTPDRLNSVEITAKIFSKLLDNLHYKYKGVCVFQKGHFPFSIVTVTPEVEHYMPDLIVAVYNRPSSNPWTEMHAALQNEFLVELYEKTYRKVSGSNVSYGSSHSDSFGNNNIHRSLVDVIGSPNILLNPPFPIPFTLHKSDTFPFKPYYLGLADLLPSRMLATELVYTATKIGKGRFIIGDNTNIWGYELPRHFANQNSNPFRAAVVSAMHGADIVTNTNTGHVASGTDNSCGQNCVVSNVTYEKFQKTDVLLQEIFPLNRMIEPGSKDEGIEDNIKGNGNYLFVVWRKYKGCLQAPGKLIIESNNVGKPEKR